MSIDVTPQRDLAPPPDGFGVVTLAAGDRRYLKQAEILSLSLRRNMPGVKLAIISDSDALAAFADVIVPLDRSLPISTAQKLLLDRYTPFKKTLFIDSDCVVTRPFHDELAQISRHVVTPILEHWTPREGSDDYLDDLAFALDKVGGEAYPKFNGGVYYFEQTPLAREVFAFARMIFADYRAYGARAFDRGGAGDETVMALALAHYGMNDLYEDGGRLMRTPTGLKGRITIDPLGGGCMFERAGGVVRPAICHFAGEYLLTPEYRLSEICLRRGVSMPSLSPFDRASATLGAAAARVARFLRYKRDGLEKRINALTQTIRKSPKTA